MADRIVVMKDGAIRQVATPTEAYHHPADLFVAEFIGAPSMNLLPGRTRDGAVELWNGARVPLSAAFDVTDERDIVLGVRPEDLAPAAGADALLRGTLSLVEPLGAETLLHVDVAGREIVASGPGRGAPEPGADIALDAPPDTLHLFDADSGVSLSRPALTRAPSRTSPPTTCTAGTSSPTA